MSAAYPEIGAVILAAGKGTRMHSTLPKVLHEILGESMLGLVADALRPVCAGRIWSVIGHEAELVRASLGERGGNYVLQTEQLGTGHALAAAWPELEESGLKYVLVVNGDTPLLTSAALQKFIGQSLEWKADLAFMSLELADPAQFGRVLRKNGEVVQIIEAKDYSAAEHGPEPKEINAGIYFLDVKKVGPLLGKIQNSNKSGEYYITDLVGLGVAGGLKVAGVLQDAETEDAQSFLGVNSPLELILAENYLRARIVMEWQEKGVLIRNPDAVRIGPNAKLEHGAELCGPCEIYGQSFIASGASLESHCWLKNTQIAHQSKIRSFCHFEGAQIGERCSVGPFARLRPGTVLEAGAHVGNFVEIKNSHLAEGVKAGHLSYLGDSDIGSNANIGAGTITCNYDGVNKHKTIIGEDAFIGSNTALVAPVAVGKAALVGAGSVVTKNVPEENLAISRAKQVNLPKRPKK